MNNLSKELKTYLLLIFIISLSLMVSVVSISCVEKNVNTEIDSDNVELDNCSIVKPKLTEKEINKTFDNIVFKIEILNKKKVITSQGSGFFIKSDGTFVTNAHVVEDAWYGRIKLDNRVLNYDIEYIYEYNKNKDIAIGKVIAPKISVVNWVEDYNVSDDVYAIGYPNNSRFKKSTKGIILNKTYINMKYNREEYIENNANIDHGSSGGVLSNAYGEIIGITTCSFDGTFGAVSIKEIEYSLNKNYIYARKTLKEYFHPSHNVILSNINFDTYFNIEVISTNIIFESEKRGNVYYKISIVPKQDDIEISGTSIYISVKIDTNYTYSQTYEYIGKQYFYSSKSIWETLYLYKNNNFYTSKLCNDNITLFSGSLESINDFKVSITVIGTIIEYY